MLTISRVKQAANEFIKVLRFGLSDVVTAKQFTPAGLTSKPIKNQIAIYAKTSDNNEPAIIGYLSELNGISEGEIKLFSIDSNGVEKTYIHIKNDGTIEFGGAADNLVKYLPLNTAMNQLILNLNTEFTKINTIYPFAFLPLTINISGAKVAELKV